jgi:hypothetical protein
MMMMLMMMIFVMQLKGEKKRKLKNLRAFEWECCDEIDCNGKFIVKNVTTLSLTTDLFLTNFNLLSSSSSFSDEISSVLKK